MKKLLLIGLFVIFGSLLLADCIPALTSGPSWGGSFASNGERIYFTATNDSGEAIHYTGGSGGGGMMGSSSQACATCHGADGRGGQRGGMMMQTINAPDIRYQSLASEGEHEEGDGHNGDVGYDLETFRMAVVEGQHPNGEQLNSVMPRWQLVDEDLSDLFDYLKSMP